MPHTVRSSLTDGTLPLAATAAAMSAPWEKPPMASIGAWSLALSTTCLPNTPQGEGRSWHGAMQGGVD